MMMNPDDFLDAKKAFQPLLHAAQEEDIQKLQGIVDNISHYDIVDTIARISSLNLLIQNQNKNGLFGVLIAAILLRDRSSYSGTAQMSSGRFRTMINRLWNLKLRAMIDPPDNPFVERIRYYGNYWVFPGINNHSTYMLQSMIDLLRLDKEQMKPEYVKKAHLLINFALTISNHIAEKLGYNMKSVRVASLSGIELPGAALQQDMKECLCFDYLVVAELLQNDQDLINLLFSEFKNGDIHSAMDVDQQSFFAHPFLNVNDETVVLLDPTILTSFVIHQLVILADAYGEKETLIREYNEVMWRKTLQSLYVLGHKKIRETEYGIELINSSSIKEAILSVGNDQLMFVFFAGDTGKGYDDNSMFSRTINDDAVEDVDQRTAYFIEHLPKPADNGVYKLVVLNSFGRIGRFNIRSNERTQKLVLQPTELHYISINEKEQKNFLPRYAEAKSKLFSDMPTEISELNYIEIYNQHDHSFYLSDEFNPERDMLMPGFEFALDYVMRAQKKEDRHLVEAYDGNYYLDVVLSDPIRHIYTVKPSKQKALMLLIKFQKLNVWFDSAQGKSIEEENLYGTIIDLLSYWLAELHEVIDELTLPYETIGIDIRLTSPIKEYYLLSQEETPDCQSISFDRNANSISMKWDAAAYKALIDETNASEKKIVLSLLTQIAEMGSCQIDVEKVEFAFENPLKKKTHSFVANRSPYLIPTYQERPAIQASVTNQLLDEIGDHFLSTKQYSIGRVADNQRCELANKVVGYLYSLLQTEIASIKPDGVFEKIILDLETSLHSIMLLRNQYAFDVACYPEKEKEIIEGHNEAQRASVALKFLAEYTAAIPPNGNRPLGIMQYDRLLAICSLIIDWAYTNDLFYYKIINTPINFLQSRRIGMEKTESNRLNQINIAARRRQLNNLSDPKRDLFSSASLLEEFYDDIDEAFLDEYGFTFQQFVDCIFALISIGEQMVSQIKRINRTVFIDKVSAEREIPKEVVDFVLKQLTLTERENYLVPPSGYSKEDVYPWRYNRALSFTRRPVILYKNDLIWGNRHLHHTQQYIVDLLLEGRFKAKGEKLKHVLGRISNKRGNEFNADVARAISSIDGVSVYEKVSKINGKRIMDNRNNNLGDIDVLCIVPASRKIIVGEVKEFSFAKNPYEMAMEYQSIFIDGKHISYMTKHKRRAQWVADHIDDVIQHFSLPAGKWSVRTVMFVSNEIISNQAYHTHEKVIAYPDICERLIKTI